MSRLSVALVLIATAAHAGGMGMMDFGPQRSEAAQIAKKWRAEGAAGMTKLVRTACRLEDAPPVGERVSQFIDDAAAAELATMGLPALKALMAVGSTGWCWREASRVYRTMFCTTSKLGPLFAPVAAALVKRGAAAEGAWNVIDAVASDGEWTVTDHGECTNREAILEKAMPQLEAALGWATGEETATLISLYESVGPRAVRMLPKVLAMIRRADNHEWLGPALEYFRGLGPDAAEAVPTLREVLTGQLGPRPFDENVQGGAARALSAIGSAAAPALPDLIAILQQCRFGGSCQSDAIVEAIVRSGSSDGAQALLDALIPDESSYWNAAIVDAVIAMGEGAATGFPIMLARSRDRSLTVPTRYQAWKAVLAVLGLRLDTDAVWYFYRVRPGTNVPLGPADWATGEALASKAQCDDCRRNNQQVIRYSHVELTADEVRAARIAGAKTTANRCRREARRPAIAEFPAAVSEAEVAALGKLDACLRLHLCGPDELEFRAATSTCCTGSWCQALAGP